MACTIAIRTSIRRRRYDRITFTEALTKRLQIMDSTRSVSAWTTNPVVVFNMYTPGILRDAVLGRDVELWLR